MTEVSDRIAYSRTRENKTQVSEQRVYDRVQREKLKAGVRERERDRDKDRERQRSDIRDGKGRRNKTRVSILFS